MATRKIIKAHPYDKFIEIVNKNDRNIRDVYKGAIDILINTVPHIEPSVNDIKMVYAFGTLAIEYKTAAAFYCEKLNDFMILLNPYFFKYKLTTDISRAYVLAHEHFHILLLHVTPLYADINKRDHKATNIAMDVVINGMLDFLFAHYLRKGSGSGNEGVDFYSELIKGFNYRSRGVDMEEYNNSTYAVFDKIKNNIKKEDMDKIVSSLKERYANAIERLNNAKLDNK